MNFKTLLVMVVAFCALATYSAPKMSLGMFKSPRAQSIDMIKEAIENDPHLSRIRFSTMSQKTLSGVADSPESLQNLKTVFEKAKKLNPELQFKVNLYPGYTPYFVTGKVVYENGKPAEDVWVQIVCSKYVVPEGQKGMTFANPESLGRYMIHAQQSGSFDTYNLPTSADAKIILTVNDSHPKKTELVVPVNTKDLVITIPNKPVKKIRN